MAAALAAPAASTQPSNAATSTGATNGSVGKRFSAVQAHPASIVTDVGTEAAAAGADAPTGCGPHMTTDAPAIEVDALTKRFGGVTAVASLSFTVPRGSVTGFLGPNGAGKTTTMRAVLGLARPTAGGTRILGVPYERLDRPITRVGAALEVTGFHPGRTARHHLAIVCMEADLPTGRVDAVLATTGMNDYADRRVGGFSSGMRQRLALATALLGDPDVLVLDEPANGLDPAGVAWLRGFLRNFASGGGSVLVSSHILSEVAEVADRVVVIDRAHLVTEGPVSVLTGSGSGVDRGAGDRRGRAHGRPSEGRVRGHDRGGWRPDGDRRDPSAGG